jgi:transposase-like protein
VRYRGPITLNVEDPGPPKSCPKCKGRLQRAGAAYDGRMARFYCPTCSATLTFDRATGQLSMSKMEVERK